MKNAMRIITVLFVAACFDGYGTKSLSELGEEITGLGATKSLSELGEEITGLGGGLSSSSRCSTFESSTIGGSTVNENSSDIWNATATTHETTRQQYTIGTYEYNSQHNTDTFGNNTHLPYRGSNANNPFGGGYSGDPFKPHGDFLNNPPTYDQPHNTDTFGNDTHLPYRGSNANNPIGGGFSGDPFKPHGNFLR